MLRERLKPNNLRMRFCLTYFLLCIFLPSFSQTFTISGTVEDINSGELLISANAYDANTLKGCITNYYGFYSLKLPKGMIKLTFSYAGYQPAVMDIDLCKDTIINPKLNPVTEISEVVVSANRHNIVQRNQMGLVEMSAIQSKQLPVILGEADILKTIQMLPGVKGGTEGTSGMYVRGGGPDQNLILLDGVPVYNASHLFGFFSVFNSDAIQSFSLLKGGFPARYGGRLSSVLDIKMKEGNNKKLQGEGSIGLISSKITLEGPIKNENTSFIVSARRTYIDALTYLLLKTSGNGDVGGYYFYDINAKINHKFSSRSRLYYSLYTGLDKFYMYQNQAYENQIYDSKAGSGWGNLINALRWNYVINDKLFSNSTLTYSKYNFFVRFDDERTHDSKKDYTSVEYTSGIYDVAGKLDFDYIPNTEHYIRFGGNFTYHNFNPGVNAIQVKNADIGNAQIDTSFGNTAISANEIYLYGEDDIEVSSRFKLNVGFHFSQFNVKGKSYASVQPRLSMRYLITDNFSAKASVIQMKQYIHLLTTANIGLPTDLWVPATDKVKPQESWQYSVGLAYNLEDKYELSVEGYYKPMLNLIEYKEGASFLTINNSWERKIETGKGLGRGIELLISKTSGKTTGWIGYTWSISDRQFENISRGRVFPYKYDRRHDIGIAIIHKSSEKFDFGVTWIYGSGYAVTLPEDKYLTAKTLNSKNYFSNEMIEYFNMRNGYRMPSYSRLDVGFNFNKKIRWGSRTWGVGAYNAYNRQNPFYIDFGYDKVSSTTGTDYYIDKKVLKQYSIFPIIPYVRYSIKF